MGGFVGEWDSWQTLEKSWKDALENSGASYLHMREFAHRRGVFEGWSEERRRLLLGNVVETIVAANLLAVGVVVRVSDFLDLPPRAQSYLRDPFFLCLQETISLLAGIAKIEQRFEEKKTALIVGFSQQDEFSSLAKRHWEAMAKLDNFGEWMGAFNFGDMRKVAALQAADLLAYELRHFFHNRESDKGRRRRWPLERIITSQRKRFYDTDLPTCQYLARDYLLAYRGAKLSDEELTELRITLKPEMLAVYE